MESTWRWRLFPRREADVEADTEPEPVAGTTVRVGGGGDDEPVLIGTISGPIEAEMAKDALAAEGIPALVKQNSLGPVYGLSFGSFGRSEVWVVPALAERARDTLIGIGVLDTAGDEES